MPKLSSTPLQFRWLIHLTFGLLACAVLAPSGALAQQHSHLFRWQAPPDNDVAGYRVYLRVSGAAYPPKGAGIDLGRQVPGSAGVVSSSVGGFSDTLEYMARLTAYDTSGNESGLSNEVTIPAVAVACVPSTCDDGNPCTVDTCSATGCAHTAAADGGVCDDGFANTIGDACFSGVCVGTVPQCTVNLDCADGDVCNGAEQCSAGTCISGTALSCSAAAQGPCMVGVCDPQLGCTASPVADGTLCNDGNAATTGDMCQVGVCSGQPLPPVVSLTSDAAGAQPLGVPVTVIATAAGASSAYRYQWWLRMQSGRWAIVQSFSPSPQVTIPTPTAGDYDLAVRVNPVGGPARLGAAARTRFHVVAPPASPTSSSIVYDGVTSSLASPQIVGTQLRFVARAHGGTGSYAFRWVLRNMDTGGTDRTPWSGNPALDWNPNTPGAYTLTVVIRDSGSGAQASQTQQAHGQIPFRVDAAAPPVAQPSPPPASTPMTYDGITSSVISPQVVGTQLRFVARAHGGSGAYAYRWVLQNTKTGDVDRTRWSNNPALDWRPNTPGVYKLGVVIRDTHLSLQALPVGGNLGYTIQ